MSGMPKRRLLLRCCRFGLGTNVPAFRVAAICGGDSLEAFRIAAWRLVMVPEARRGERGQEPAALEQGYPQALARPPAQIPTGLLREVHPASLAERAFSEKPSLAERA